MKYAASFHLLALFALTGCSTASDDVDLSGEWSVKLSGADSGAMTLPGTTDLGAKGEHVLASKPYEAHLTREWDFVGPATYARDIEIPDSWKDRDTELFLERVMWRSRVRVDGRETGSPEDSLSTPHIHRLGRLAPGKHRIEVEVDNRLIHPIGDKGHGYGAQTQSLWNGIVGKIALRSHAADRLGLVRVFPSNDGTLKIEVAGPFAAGLTLAASVDGGAPFVTQKTGTGTAILTGKAVDKPVLWSEFTPKTYGVTVTLTDASGRTIDTHVTHIGFRTVARDGNRLLENGREVFMRGNLECAVFPKTGHPPADVESWRRIWKIYREHNLNHARFHSWCPPEAAFVAADEAGISLQIETPIWIDGWMTGPNPRKEMDTAGYPKGLGKNDRSIDTFTKAEMRRILDAYGNHPSFVFFCLGNELGTSDFKVTGEWIREAKAYDTRRLYAASTARTITPYCDFNATHAIPGIGWVRQYVEFGTAWDYEKSYAKAPVPIIAHEIGQWPVYVDWKVELPKYTGPLKPYRLAELAEAAKKSGLYDRAAELRAASGGTNRILYRYEIESFLRTPDCRGFQLLNMQDFSGQGEALVGWLDSFYESKGTTDPAAFRHYCAPVVPLLRTPAFVFKSDDKPSMEAVVSQYGPADIAEASARWVLRDDAGATLASGELAKTALPAGGVTSVGKFTPDFSRVLKASHATLTLEILTGGVVTASNAYDLWVYPGDATLAKPAKGVVFTEDWTGVASPALARGETVVLDAHALGGGKAGKLAGWFPLYWSVPFFPGQSTETIGLSVHADHPALAGFPTPNFADWNWHRICRGAHGFDVTDITPVSFRGIAEPVSDFHYNRRLASIFEVRVGKGRLLVCGYDLSDRKASSTPETGALRGSLLAYAARGFEPASALESKVLDKLFENPELKLSPVAPRFANADLYVRAGGKFTGNGNASWKQSLDDVARRANGVNYTVKADGIWRDAEGVAWHGSKITIDITPRPGVAGTLHVRFADWNRQGRTGIVTVEGKPRELAGHAPGGWVSFPIIREDTIDSKLELNAEVSTGGNLMISDIAFVPNE